MIGYDAMYVTDAYNYFHNCWAWYVSEGGRKVTPFLLNMRYYDEDNDTLAHDYEYTVAGMGNSMSMTVTGEDLFMGTQWITHRFQLGYVATGRNQCLRLDAEPVNSRMIKGLQSGFCQSLALVITDSDPEQGDSRVWAMAARTRSRLDFDRLPQAIADVLAVGSTPVMRGRVPPNEGNARARIKVKEFMAEGGATVCVPDFRVALIRHRTHADFAYILHNGTYIGKVCRKHDGEVYCKLNKARSASRQVSKYVEDTRATLAQTLIAAEIQWANR